MKKMFPLLFCLIVIKTNAQQVKADTSFNKLSNLNTIVVKSKKQFIEQLIDKIVVNVQADITALSSTAFEIIQKAPGISVSGDDNINLSGKAGVNVFIDGRPTQMSGKQLANFLRAMPGSSIDKIEILTNPSAKYDAQGNAGIINIKLKKNKLKGTNGNLNIAYKQQVHYRSNAAASINHRANKLNLFANTSVDNNLQHTHGYINRNVQIAGVTKKFNNTTVDIDRNRALNLRTGLDFYANKKNSFSILLQANTNRSPFQTPGFTNISSNGIVDSALQTTNNNLYKNKRYNSNVNYKFEDTLGNELNIDADYTHFNNTNNTALQTQFLDKNKTAYKLTANNLAIATAINIFALKADYSKNIKKWNAKMETGLKYTSVNANNSLYATTLTYSAMLADTGRSNLFNYTENVYANITKRIKKIEYQIGVRIENTAVQGNSIDLKNTTINNPDTTYFNIFPTAFVSYNINDKNRLALSYAKRINRPNYQAMNPFETIYDIYTSEKGNPYLKPQYSNNIEVKYSYKYALNIGLGYNHTKDYSQTITTQIAEKTQATESNIGMLDNVYLNINAPLPFTKWWQAYANVTAFYNHYKGNLPNGILNETTLGLNYYIQNNFALGKGWSTQLSSWFNAGTKQAIFNTKAFGSVDIAVRKKFAKDRANISLTLTDILNTQKYKQVVNFENMDFTYLRKWESRGVNLQFSWSFGKNKYKARDRNTNEDANRIKVKN